MTAGLKVFTDLTALIPLLLGFNARTRSREYGGGAFCVCRGVVYFSNYEDGRLYRQTSPAAAPEPLTPAGPFRHGDLDFHAKVPGAPERFCTRSTQEALVLRKIWYSSRL